MTRPTIRRRRPPAVQVVRSPGKPDVVIPLEHAEQVRVVSWARLHARHWPELGLLFAIPNGAHKSRAAAGAFRAEGLRKGVPDLCLPVPRAGYGALFLEMKRRKGGSVSPEQRDWLERLTAAGNRAVVCRGAQAAIDELTAYLAGEGEAA